MKYIHDKDTPANNIVEYLAAHRAAIAELEAMLPIACERDGHQWDNVDGVLTSFATDYELVERRVSDGDLGGHTVGTGEYNRVGTNYIDVFARTCVRCGKIERQRPIAQKPVSPFAAVAAEDAT